MNNELMVGIVNKDKEFLIPLPSLKSYLEQHKEDNMPTIIIKIQSLNDESLKIIKNNGDFETFNTTIDSLSDKNVKLQLDILLGLPYETIESYYTLLRFIIHKMFMGNHSVSPNILKILPNTDMMMIAEEKGFKMDTRYKDNQDTVYATQTMPRKHFIDCLQMTAVLYKIFGSRDINSEVRLKDRFFDLQKDLKVKRLSLLCELTDKIKEILPSNSDYNYFEDSEKYLLSGFNEEYSDEELIKLMDGMKLK